LDLPYSDDLATNKLIATNLSAIATFENYRRRARQREGIEAAKKAGKYRGRKTVVTKDLIKKVEKYKNLGISVTEIARLRQKSRATILFISNFIFSIVISFANCYYQCVKTICERNNIWAIFLNI